MHNELNNGLVSIIIPCYNGERTLARCLDSLLVQSWSHLEIIFVNDGSTDQSASIAKRYKTIFQDAGILFVYRKQENAGLGGAINTGLKYVSGEYLCWGDVDDFWFKDSILVRKRFLDDNPEYGSVSSDAYFFSEDDLTIPRGLVSTTALNLEDENQFMNNLSGRPLYCSGCHMLRMSALLDVNPKRDIYPARNGQNNQLLMPIYYKYKHKFLPVPLYGYVVSADSMSHKVLGKQEERERILEYYKSINITINNISMPEKELKKYIMINERRKFDSLIDFGVKHKDHKRVFLYSILKKFLKVYLG